MSEQPWHPTDPVVETHCDGCGRGLPTYLRDRAESMRATLAPLPRFGDAAAADHTFCGHCADEVRELTDAMTPAGSAGVPTSHADLRAAPACGLCGDGIDQPTRVLTVGWRGARHGSEDRFPLCGQCDAILVEFLGNVPDEQPDGDVFYGTAPDIGVPAAAADRDALLRAFDAVRTGDDLHVESHDLPEATTPADYHVAEGRVVRRDEAMGIEDLVFETETGERYRLTRPAPTVDRLTLRRETVDGTEALGEVTVLDAETTPESRTASAAEAENATDGVVEIDADSALIPDSIDLGSSAD